MLNITGEQVIFKNKNNTGYYTTTSNKLEDGTFEVITNKGTVHRAKAVAIAGGLGTFEPRKPLIDNIADYEEKGVEYFVKNPEHFRDKNIVIMF